MFGIKEGSFNKKVFDKIKSLAKDANKAINLAFYKIGSEHVDHARKLMREPKSGRVYKIDGNLHKASAPGEAPAILRRDLYDGLDYMVTGNTMRFIEKAPHGAIMELGSPGGKVKPRPFMGPTITGKYKDSYNAFVTELKDQFEP